jgi:hypothetical protein
MGESLPSFRYYPDPVATGSFVASDRRCICCASSRGFIYTGPAYATEDYDDCFCPWCIAEGSAHDKYDVSFNLPYALKAAPRRVVEEIEFRTPGFWCLEQGEWQEHCRDAALYLGVPDREAIRALAPQVVAQLRSTTGVSDDELWGEILDIAGDETGIYRIYLFRCVTCQQLVGFVACE